MVVLRRTRVRVSFLKLCRIRDSAREFTQYSLTILITYTYPSMSAEQMPYEQRVLNKTIEQKINSPSVY